jgi:outer membrane lipoprotein
VINKKIGVVMRRFLILLIIFLPLTSCAHVISSSYVQSSVKDVSFSLILTNPDAYLNDTFILGGTIFETKNTGEGTEIEIVQNPIDRYGYIIDPDISEGRYIITTSRRLDPFIYKRNRMITFAGKLIGTRKKLLGEHEYIYPFFEAEEIYLWKREVYYPPYSYYYDPFYYPYPYWYGPFWHRPYFWW